VKIEMTTSRWLPLVARAITGDRRGRVPAHALPPAERPKVEKTSNRRKPERHVIHDRVRTAAALGAHRASTKTRQWLVRVEPAPRIPEVADMLVIGESVWQDGLQAGSIRYTVDAVTRCSTGVFTLAVWGSGVRAALALLIFNDVCRQLRPSTMQAP
jgi:hypothetical protein